MTPAASFEIYSLSPGVPDAAAPAGRSPDAPSTVTGMLERLEDRLPGSRPLAEACAAGLAHDDVVGLRRAVIVRAADPGTPPAEQVLLGRMTAALYWLSLPSLRQLRHGPVPFRPDVDIPGIRASMIESGARLQQRAYEQQRRLLEP